MNQKENQVDHQILNQLIKDHLLNKYSTNKPKPKAKAKANPKHDTETINNDDPEFWKEQNLGLIKDQLGKRNFKNTKILMEVRMNKRH